MLLISVISDALLGSYNKQWDWHCKECRAFDLVCKQKTLLQRTAL